MWVMRSSLLAPAGGCWVNRPFDTSQLRRWSCTILRHTADDFIQVTGRHRVAWGKTWKLSFAQSQPRADLDEDNHLVFISELSCGFRSMLISNIDHGIVRLWDSTTTRIIRHLVLFSKAKESKLLYETFTIQLLPFIKWNNFYCIIGCCCFISSYLLDPPMAGHFLGRAGCLWKIIPWDKSTQGQWHKMSAGYKAFMVA